jgi:protein TonB
MLTSSLRLIAVAALALVLPLGAQDTKATKGTQPRIVHKIEPQYSEQARTEKVEGTVTLKVVVDTNGHPSDIRVVKSLGHGLDEKAIDAVEKWEFQPGTINGEPVAVAAIIQVPFRLQ